ncbi:MAG: hypothetical protein H8D23_04975 [Candidatus Brocadiales bacterium]|nr:hypothetical protein [Candidatus Brocadiales bacterium]
MDAFKGIMVVILVVGGTWFILYLINRGSKKAAKRITGKEPEDGIVMKSMDKSPLLTWIWIIVGFFIVLGILAALGIIS